MKQAKTTIRPPWFDRRRHFRQNVIRVVIHLFGWIGIAVLFYIGFSFFFDTPVEYRMKESTRKLKEEYEALNLRYDSVEKVLGNVIERDRNVFKILFEAEPYDLDEQYGAKRWVDYENLLEKNNKELGDAFFAKSGKLAKHVSSLKNSYETLERKIAANRDGTNHIPAIQPVINKELTLLTASYGLRIHPFYKSLTSHQGVDYTIPEGSRVFATADGRVKDVIRRRSSSGLTVILDHGNGYETEYRHLSKINVRKGQNVRRGDIIALSGNTGLSLAPHLHYEIRHNGMRVDPIHYFFLELSPAQYQKMMRIAQSGMQSFD
mgnify:FL=1